MGLRKQSTSDASEGTAELESDGEGFHRPGVDDNAWQSAEQVLALHGERGARPNESYTLAGFVEAIRAARRGASRTLVVLLLFLGPRRTGDIEEHIRRLAEQSGLSVIIASVDLLTDSD